MRFIKLRKFRILLVLLLSVLFMNFSCESGDSSKTSEENATTYEETVTEDFSFYVFGRNNSVVLFWTDVKFPETNKSFDSVQIEYKTKDKTVQTITNLDLKLKKYVISNLENNIEYYIEFTGILDNKKYFQSRKIIPASYKQEVVRLTSINADGKTYISFTIPEFEDNENYSEPDIKNVNLYYGDEFIFDTEFKKNLAHEKISPEIKEDSTKAYKNYYSLVSDYSDYAFEHNNYKIRFVNSNNVESEEISFETKNSNLPVVNVSVTLNETNIEDFKDKSKIDATLSVLNSDNKITDAKMTIKGRGNSSWNFAPKKSYTIKFDAKQPFLGFPKNKSFSLIANYFDKTLLRNVTSYELAKNVFTNMKWASSVKSVNLFINNVYQGIYTAVETIKISSNRVNIPDVSDCTDVNNFDEFGFVMEIDSRQEEDFNFISKNKVPFSLKEPEGGDLISGLTEKIQEKIQNVENVLYSADFKKSESPNYYENYLNTDSFIDWWLIEEFAKNTDSNFYSSCYMYFDPADKKIYMGPVWDFDLGFGNTNVYNSFEESYKDFKCEEKITAEDGTTYGNWITRLKEDSAFFEKAKTRWNELRNEIEEYFKNCYELNYSSLNKDKDLNFIRWEILGKSVWKSPVDVEKRITYDDEIDYFKKWKNSRIQWLDSQFN